MTGAAWSSSPRSTTCSRALRRRQCRTSTWPSVSRKPEAFHWNDRLAPSPAQAGEGPKQQLAAEAAPTGFRKENNIMRSEEHTSELQSIMRISYAVFCLKKKKHNVNKKQKHTKYYNT